MSFDILTDDFAASGINEITPTITYVTEDGIPEQVAQQAVRSRDVASAIESWMRGLEQEAQGARAHAADIFNRKEYVGSRGMFKLMGACAAAVEEDDILSTLADTTEGLALPKMGWEMYDRDQEDVWNQIAAQLDMDARLKEMWRELFKVSQFTCAIYWERQELSVRTHPLSTVDVDAILEGKEPEKKAGNRERRRTFNVMVPTALSLLDPTKVVPVGTMMFNRERFAYIADAGEDGSFASVMRGDRADDLVLRLVERKYTPSEGERSKMTDWGVDVNRLWLLRQDAAFRHTLTRAQYETFAIPRLKSALELVELKRHLRQADRASLVGSTNFIILIRKGSDKIPAKQAEIDNLHQQAKMVARMPILVGDHRLSVEIVTPSTDNTLQEGRYDVLDARLVFRALQSFAPMALKSAGSATTGVSELSRTVAVGMESRRHSLARALERYLLKPTVERNSELDEVPKLKFRPKRISLDFNAVISKTVLELRDRGDLSRETALEEFDYDQDVEALRRLREVEQQDKIFRSQVPFSSPQTNPHSSNGQPQETNPRSSGRQGGRPTGVVETKPRERASQDE